jgi:hypothetical protein
MLRALRIHFAPVTSPAPGRRQRYPPDRHHLARMTHWMRQHPGELERVIIDITPKVDRKTPLDKAAKVGEPRPRRSPGRAR